MPEDSTLSKYQAMEADLARTKRELGVYKRFAERVINGRNAPPL